MRSQSSSSSPPSFNEAQSDIERRLHAIRQRLIIEALAQSFVICTKYIPQDAERVFDGAELPLALERIAASVTQEWQTWLAWTDRRRIWFMVAELDPAINSDCPQAVKLFFYDDDGRIVSSGTWMFHPSGDWELLPL